MCVKLRVFACEGVRDVVVKLPLLWWYGSIGLTPRQRGVKTRLHAGCIGMTRIRAYERRMKGVNERRIGES